MFFFFKHKCQYLFIFKENKNQSQHYFLPRINFPKYFGLTEHFFLKFNHKNK
eukprot:TRINITY_DN10670_c0_g1_i1.p1 TRINITY_DN10670_c0_g1~~TRINITY_DN10670_c0_g1_i1.p1  ORF type:complete len:52 (+),score=6.72 TRINITY_DN10670_c0_g1_i1:46-201(+)